MVCYSRHTGIGDFKPQRSAGYLLMFFHLVYRVCVCYRFSFRATAIVFIINILLAEYEARNSAAGSARGTTTDPESDFPNRRISQILAGIFAAAAMLNYALFAGLLQVDLYFIAFRLFCFYYLQIFLYFLVISFYLQEPILQPLSLI